MSDIAPNEPTRAMIEAGAKAISQAPGAGNEAIARQVATTCLRAAFAAAHPVPEDAWLKAVAKLKTHAKGYIDQGDRAAWSDGWDACLRAVRYLAGKSKAK